MREYDEQLYTQWCQSVEANSLQYLKSHILYKEIVSPGAAAAAAAGHANVEREYGKAEPVEKVYVNFRPELRDIIKETKYLDKMGLMVPEAALNVALQVRPTIIISYGFGEFRLTQYANRKKNITPTSSTSTQC